jgi:hypothetical protein
LFCLRLGSFPTPAGLVFSLVSVSTHPASLNSLVQSTPHSSHPPKPKTMDFDRSVSKLKKEQEKRRAEALRKAERYVAMFICMHGSMPFLPLYPPSLCPQALLP